MRKRKPEGRTERVKDESPRKRQRIKDDRGRMRTPRTACACEDKPVF